MVFRDTKNLGGNLLRAVENVFLNFLCMRQNAVLFSIWGFINSPVVFPFHFAVFSKFYFL